MGQHPCVALSQDQSGAGRGSPQPSSASLRTHAASSSSLTQAARLPEFNDLTVAELVAIVVASLENFALIHRLRKHPCARARGVCAGRTAGGRCHPTLMMMSP